MEEKYCKKTTESMKLEDNVFIDIDEEFVWPDLNNQIYNEHGFCYGLKDHFGILVDGSIVPCCLDENEPLGQQKTYLQKYLQNKGFTDFGKSFFF